MGYRFEGNVFACEASGVVIVLNLRTNRYAALPKTLADTLLALRDGKPHVHMQTQLEALCKAGVLTETYGNDFLWPTPDVNVPLSSILDGSLLRVGLFDLCEATARRLFSIVRFKCQPLHRTIEHIQRRKLDYAGRSRRHCVSLSAKHLAAFLDTRFLVPTQDRCLPWSIACLDAFAHRCADLTLVIGVRSDPFGAHAWVQQADMVLTDELDRVLLYTPILAV
ncbi:lasso peptide biosynthesis B2 protein [Asticcacaulis sp. W401b]|uniref:lasso peptide biosynthesis B2 protein n=1 Tax=Asticcacaulis sp. W401b TaxID=3388666 RepID=UPI003970D681